MRDLLRGAVSLKAYVALLANLRALYSTLETELQQHSSDVALSGISWDTLRRTAALNADLQLLANSQGDSVAVEPATQSYVQHLQQLAAHAPRLLVAHAYLRYLGDLYGGQIMKRILVKTFPDFGPEAFSFYEFGELPDPESFKVRFRQAIDELPNASDEADEWVAEVRRGYEFHSAIFSEIASDEARWRQGDEAP